MGGHKWDDKSDADLLSACLEVQGGVKGPTLSAAHELVQKRGYSYTLKAAQHRMQHLQKLRRKEGKDGNEASAPSTPGGPATPATPASARKNAPAIKGTASRSAGKRKMHAEPSIEEHVDDEEEPAFTPSKKAKIEDDGMDDIKQEPSAI